MDDLMEILAQLQEELSRTASVNEVIEVARIASERVAPIIENLDRLLNKLQELNYPETLRDLREIVFSMNRAIGAVQNETTELKNRVILMKGSLESKLEELNRKDDENFMKLNTLINSESNIVRKRQLWLLSINSLILLSVIALFIISFIR